MVLAKVIQPIVKIWFQSLSPPYSLGEIGNFETPTHDEYSGLKCSESYTMLAHNQIDPEKESDHFGETLLKPFKIPPGDYNG